MSLSNSRRALWLGGCLLLAGCRSDPSPAEPESGKPAPQRAVAATPEPVPLPGLERLDEAVQDQLREVHARLEEALAANRDDAALAERYGETGMYFHTYELYDAAAAAYRNAQRLAPDDVRWAYYLADALREQGDAAGAVGQLQRALELDDDYVPAWIWLGRVQLDLDAVDDARAAFERAFGLDPRSAAVLVGLGRVAAREKRYGDAVERFEAALALAPEADNIHFQLGMAYRGLGDAAAAEHHLELRGDTQAVFADPLFERIEELAVGGRSNTDLGERLGRMGRYEEAVAALSEAIETNPDDAVAYLYLGIALTRTGDPQAGLEAFGQVLRIDPANDRAHMHMATILLTQGREQEAVAHMRAALESHPDSVAAHLRLARSLQRLGDHEGALEHYRRTVELDPGNGEARLRRAFTLVKLGRYAEARRSLEEGIEVFPEEHAFQHALARVLAAAPDASVRDGRRAVEITERLAKQIQSLGLGETIGMALAEAGLHGQAAAWQLQLIQTAQQQGAPRDVLARLERNLGLYRDAQACREPWPEDDPVFLPPVPESP